MRNPRRPLPTWADIVLLPLINITLAFVTVSIIVRLNGVDPFHALRLLVVGALGSPESIGYTLYYATNFIFTGLAVAVAFPPVAPSPPLSGWPAFPPAATTCAETYCVPVVSPVAVAVPPAPPAMPFSLNPPFPPCA